MQDKLQGKVLLSLQARGILRRSGSVEYAVGKDAGLNPAYCPDVSYKGENRGVANSFSGHFTGTVSVSVPVSVSVSVPVSGFAGSGLGA